MGIYCRLFQITNAEVEQIWANPEAVTSVIEAKKTTRPAPPSMETQLTLFDLPVLPNPTTWYVDLDKMWQALHFLLNGNPWGGMPPLSLAILGGEVVKTTSEGEIKMLVRAEVRRVAEALSALTHEELYKRFEPAKFAAADIYPSAAWDEDRDHLFSGLMMDFDELVAIYRDAELCENAVLIDIG
jgi:hypothetical protein